VAYVTHDQSKALAVSDQIIVMDQGVIFVVSAAGAGPWCRVGLGLADHGVSVVQAFVTPTSHLLAVPPDNAAMNHAKTTEKPAEDIPAVAADAVIFEQLTQAV